MSRKSVLALFFLAIFLQSGTYGLTFLLPDLFFEFDANEKDVGAMLAITAIVTIFSVYFSGHFTDLIGRMKTLALSGLSITASLFLFSGANSVGWPIILASALIGFGWGLMYTLAPVALTSIVRPDERVRLFSLFSVFMMAGFGLSPVFAAVLDSYGLGIRGAFRTVGVFCIISGMIFFLLRGPMAAISITQSTVTKTRLSIATVIDVIGSKGRLPIFMAFLGASVFAGLNNFQTVYAQEQGQDYAEFFLAYTVTVIVCRLLLAGFSGGKSPYRTIAILQTMMVASVILFIFIDGNRSLYLLSAILFGFGYGASYPILAAMAANDSRSDLVAQTVQLFSLTYFIGIFGFPFVAGWLIVEISTTAVMVVIGVMAAIETGLAFSRHISNRDELV